VTNVLAKQIVSQYQKIYHMSDKRNWTSVRQHGLLSTTALLDLFEYRGKRRFEIESQVRIQEFRITHKDYGEVFVRDQDPMRDRPKDGIYLANSLVGITAQTWFEFLNSKVFFWADLRWLGYMLGARLYRNTSHYVFTVDTGNLLTCHSDSVLLSSINSGSLYGRNGRESRSLDTFKPIDKYWASWITELTVDFAVSDIFDLAISVDECISQRANTKSPYKIVKHIWP
jgi:hypothetical protein